MKTIKAMGLDLGNGYIKIKTQDKDVQEPSVFSHVPQVSFNQGEDFSVQVGNNAAIYLGNDAIESNLKVMSAVGITDALTRYMSKDYANLLYGFIAKAYLTDIVIENLVLGLPNDHFRECKDVLKNQFSNKKQVVTVMGEQHIIEIKDVYVLPQPIGVYFKEQISNCNTLVIDLGTGTNDYTEFNKLGNIVNMFANDDGLKKFYLEVLQYLKGLYPGHKLTVSDVPKLLIEGLRNICGNEKIDLMDDYVISLQNKYASYILQPVIEQYDYLNHFDEIIITGGGAEAFRNALLTIKDKVKNIRIVDNPQFANAEGFYLFAETCAEAGE